MESVADSRADEDLHLLTAWGEPEDRKRISTAGALSLFVHAVGVLALLLIPSSWFDASRRLLVAQQVTPLVEPLTEPTQTIPNKTKPNRDFDAESMHPRPRIQVPQSAPSTTRPAARQATPQPPPVAAPAAPAALPEPPKIEAKGMVMPPMAPPQAPPALPVQPQIQAPESKPKSPFESVGAQTPVPGGGLGRVAVPNTSVSEAIRGAVHGSSGGVTVGDAGVGIGGLGEAMNQPPTPGRMGSNLELKSDPQGVDFRPYLIQVLAAVRRNWWAVMPEAARLGRRGHVGILFSIARNGSVPKLAIASYSGTDALDRAAVVGVSASSPFPPLPAEYKGQQIQLQLNFAYNMPAR